MDEVEEALAVVQEFDPLGVAARNLRECLLIQLHVLDPQNTLAHQLVSECLPKRTLAAGSSVPAEPAARRSAPKPPAAPEIEAKGIAPGEAHQDAHEDGMDDLSAESEEALPLSAEE